MQILPANELERPATAARISTGSSRVAAWVIPTNEELMVARHTRDFLDTGAQV